LAHDFYNLLGILLGNLELARDRLEGSTELYELVNEAVEAGWRGADLIQSLLAYARREPLQPSRIDPNQLIENTVTLLRRIVPGNIEISLKLGSGIWPVKVDVAQLNSSLSNLLMNASDAMPLGGCLIIITENRTLNGSDDAGGDDVQAGHFVAIEVSDTGIGMSDEIRSRIFEPFFTTKPRGAGTGLGLSMVFSFIRQSGGHIQVDSKPGQGTTVSLHLPRDDAEAATTNTVVRQLVLRGDGQTVLVVEDDRDLRRILRRQLTDLGYRVHESETATEALMLTGREKVDLLLIDIILPGDQDGMHLAKDVRARLPDIKVILTSGFLPNHLSLPKDQHDGLPFLRKPYTKAELASLLKATLAAGDSAQPDGV
jgi:CheY-like chemotaxis protein